MGSVAGRKQIEEKDKHLKIVANISNNLERSLTENQRQEEILKDKTESSFANSFCFMPNADSEALNVLSAPSEDSEDSTTFSEKDGMSIKFDDNKSYQVCSYIT